MITIDGHKFRRRQSVWCYLKTEVLIVLAIALIIFAKDLLAQSGIRYIHQERSLYRNILVTEDSQRRCLRFTITSRSGQNQSCRYLDKPVELVFPYAKMTLSSLLVQSNPQRILIVGLGGGTLSDTYSQLFPEAEIVISEIDDAVVRVAQEYFGFQETDKISVDVGDARVFIKRAGLRGEKYDLVILDAFNGEYIPEHLMTVEFLEEVKRLLPDDGTVVANTFSTSRLYAAESNTYREVFGEIYNLRMSGTGNRVIIASIQSLPDTDLLESRAPAFRELLEPFGMDVTEYPRVMSKEVSWDTSERILTDQYSPANLLNN
ncbi:MAG: fused MFS/spermidine synthase [Gammaproteobacteria bacterium]|nr:fused MFS/spermidine synthase [Gammaproteobacteria bacterium]